MNGTRLFLLLLPMKEISDLGGFVDIGTNINPEVSRSFEDLNIRQVGAYQGACFITETWKEHFPILAREENTM